MFIFLIIGLLAGALVIIFAVQNVVTVSVAFLAWQFEGSLALIIVVAVVVGMIIGSLLYVPTIVKKKIQISMLRKSNARLEEELFNKKTEIEEEKSKSAATNAYLDDLEKKQKIEYP